METIKRVGTRGSPTLTRKPTAELGAGGGPQIDDPRARSYAARVQERQRKKGAATLKGKAPPLGHVESPPSEKMEAIAHQSGGSLPVPHFFTDVPPNQSPPPDQPSSAPPQIQGVGASYPVNQAMARGEVERPVTLREANQMSTKSRPALSPESVQAIKMTQVDTGEPEEPEPEPPKEQFKSVAEETQQELDQASDQFEPDIQVDVDSVVAAREGIMSPQRREAIEARLKPMDIGDLIMKREIAQEVVIIPDKLVITLRTFSQRENIWVMQYLYDFPGSNLYVQELLNTCRLVCGLVSINGQYLPDHRSDVGTPTETVDREAFNKKMFHVTSFPVQLVADMSVQMMWFQDRVDKLLTLDVLKNG